MTATVDLLDASVWVALGARDHVHHARAGHFWDGERATEAAFCRITALALVRLLMNPAVMQYGVLAAAEAWAQYEAWCNHPSVTFLVEPSGIESVFGEFLGAAVQGHRGVTDAYLAAFARTAGCRLVSFDGGFRRFEGLDFLHLIA